jgi:hypothetical protein
MSIKTIRMIAIETSPGVEHSERFFKPIHDIIGALRVEVESEFKDISEFKQLLIFFEVELVLFEILVLLFFLHASL